MKKACPKCGGENEINFKFCYNCGTNLSQLKEPETPSSDPVANKPSFNKDQRSIIICENCGWENYAVNSICDSCGVPLISSPISASSEQNISVTDKTTRNRPVNPTLSKEKSLNQKKLLSIIIIFVLLAFLVIFFSGVLEQPTAINTPVATQTAPGVSDQLNSRIAQIESHLQHEPDDHNARLELANMQNDARLFQQAISNYEKYLAVNPLDADARIDMGISYYNVQDYQKAIREMERALNDSPRHQIGHLNLGIVNLTAGNLEISRDWLKKAVEIDSATEAGRRAKELLDSH